MNVSFFKTVFLFGLMLIWASCVFGQSGAELKIQLTGGAERHLVTLFKFSGMDMLLIDSARTDALGTLGLNVPESTENGILRMYLGSTLAGMHASQPPQFLDIIYSGQNMAFSTSHFAPLDSLRVEAATDFENIQFLNYQKRSNVFEAEMNSLGYQIFNDTTTGKVNSQVFDLFKQMQFNWATYEDSLIAINPTAWFTRIVKANRFPYVDATLSNDERITFLKQNFFNQYIFTDPELLKTNLIEARVISYVQMYFGYGLSDKQQDDEFIKAIDFTLSKASEGDAKVYSYVLNNLVTGFEMNGRSGVLDHLNAVYGESACENDMLSESSRKRLESSARNALGKTAVNIDAVALNGSKVELGSINSDFTLIVFWASWCDHCRELLPLLRNEIAMSRLGLTDNTSLTVIAVSLDEDVNELNRFITENDYSSWSMLADLKKWEGEIVRNYNIYATPTIYVLDKEKKIIAKPSTIADLKDSLTDL